MALECTSVKGTGTERNGEGGGSFQESNLERTKKREKEITERQLKAQEKEALVGSLRFSSKWEEHSPTALFHRFNYTSQSIKITSCLFSLLDNKFLQVRAQVIFQL